jgi:translocation and assembly module TamA
VAARALAKIYNALAAIGLALLSNSAAAKIEIEISGVNELLENNVRAYLSVTHYAERNDLTAEIVSRIERRIPAETAQALQPLGYYSPTVRYASTRLDDQSHWRIQIEIDPGYAVRLSEVNIAIDGEGTDNESLRDLLARQDLKPGGRLDHGVYEGMKAELIRTAKAAGYLDAELTRNELIIDPQTRRATVIITLSTGAQYRFGNIEIQQPVLKDSVARRLLRMRQGDAYTSDALLESQYALDDSQYFTNVELEPGTPNEAEHTVPLKINAQKNKRNSYALSGGYGTDTRARGKLTWDNRFVNERGHRSQVELVASGIGQEITGKYIVPVMDVALEKLEFELASKKQELPSTISRRVEFAVGLTQAFKRWQSVMFVRLSKERDDYINLDCVVDANSTCVSDSNPDCANNPDASCHQPNKETFLIVPGISFATLPPNLLDHTPRRFLLFAELTGSPKTLGSDATFLQFRVQGERVFDMNPRWHLRTRGQLGVTWTEDFDSVPLSHRFFAGGDNSVRGFGLNELPFPNGKQVGARNLLVASVEIERDLPKNFSAAVFVDGGNAIDSFGDALEYSVGVGGRYRLANVASIGVDLAQGISVPHRSPHFHLRLTTLF